jgi:hypothetical protein
VIEHGFLNCISLYFKPVIPIIYCGSIVHKTGVCQKFIHR